MKMIKKVLSVLAVIAFWLLIWNLVAISVGKELLMPTPWSTCVAMWELLKTKQFYLATAGSLVRILIGYAIGIVLGLVFGILRAFSKFCDALFSPIDRIIKATPISSIIILLLLWLSVGTVPIPAVALVVVPIIAMSVYEGINSTDLQTLEMARFFGVPRMKQLRFIYWETVRSRFFAACITSIGLAWKSGVAAEVLSTPKFSMGAKLYESKLYLETADLFAWTIAVIAMSMLFEIGIKKLSEVRVKGSAARKHNN